MKLSIARRVRGNIYLASNINIAAGGMRGGGRGGEVRRPYQLQHIRRSAASAPTGKRRRSQEIAFQPTLASRWELAVAELRCKKGKKEWVRYVHAMSKNK